MAKKVLISVILIGIVLIITGLILAGGSFEKIVEAFNSDNDYSFVEKNGSEEVKEINIKIVSGNVVFHVYEEEGYKLEYYESEYNKKEVTLVDNVLIVDNKVKPRFRFFNINYNTSKIATFNIYLPNNFNGKANIETSSGNATISDFKFTTLKINVSSGNIILNKVDVEEDTIINTSSGNTKINNFKTNSLIVKTSSGNIELIDADVNTKVDLKATSGKVEVNTSKIPSILVQASSGNVNIVNVESDDVDIRLSSGNSKIKLYGSDADYKIDASVSSGKIYYQGQKIKGSLYDASGSKSIKVRCSSGDIEIDFINK